MNLTLLKHNAEILLEVSQNYEKLLQKRTNTPAEEAKTLEAQINTLKNQILFLLTAIKKSSTEQNYA